MEVVCIPAFTFGELRLWALWCGVDSATRVECTTVFLFLPIQLTFADPMRSSFAVSVLKHA